MSNPHSTTSNPKPALLNLPTELRHQIWVYAFGNLDLWPFQPPSQLAHTCEACRRDLNQTFNLGLDADNVNEPTPSSASSTSTSNQASTTTPSPPPSSTTPQPQPTATTTTTTTPPPPPTIPNLLPLKYPLYTPHFLPLLTNKQIHSEASSIFHSTQHLHLTCPTQLINLRHTTSFTLRSKPQKITLYVHLTDTSRQTWHSALSTLTPSTFPSLTHITINNHMRSPTSYDRLVDAIYLAGPLCNLIPLSPSPLTACSTSTKLPTIKLNGSYTHPHETMFESPLLGPITTADSIDAHRDVVEAVTRDTQFRVCARENDWEGMTARLLAVARMFEEGWLEALQRRRLGGLTVDEIQSAGARSQREREERGERGEMEERREVV